MFQQYYIRPNKSTASPGNIIFFDTESWYDPETAYETGQFHRLRLGVAISGRLEGSRWTREKRCRFKTAAELWDFVASRSHPRVPVWLFGHNVGYDLITGQFPELLRSGEFRIFDPKKDATRTDILGQQFTKSDGFICTENPPVIINVTHRDGWKLICIDTFNFWVTSLAKIGELVGHKKLAMPKLNDPDDKWFEYCEGDVEVLKHAVLGLIGWVKDNNLGKFRFTAPSQAMAAFRHRFMPHKILCHNNVKLRTFERQAYYGGRLECYYIGDVQEKVYELDVSSLYPSVMQDHLYPVKVEKWATPETHTHVPQVQLDSTYVATVRLKTKSPYPKRDCRVGTIYPIGEYTTTLAGPELVRAVETNAIQDVLSWCKFELKDIFSDFVNWFWNYRQEQKAAGNKLNADLAKLLMNGLYGKFGQKTNAWQDRPDMVAHDSLIQWIEGSPEDGDAEIYRCIGPCVQQWTGKQEHPTAFPAIAAYVTSYARERMLGLRTIAGDKNVYYLVTDALFVNQPGFDNLQLAEQLSETELGMLRIKHESDYAKFEALHHYTIGEHQVRGSRKKSARDLEDGSIVEIHFESIDKALKRVPDGSVHVKPVTKKYMKQYTRGNIGADGWVTPLFLMEE